MIFIKKEIFIDLSEITENQGNLIDIKTKKVHTT